MPLKPMIAATLLGLSAHTATAEDTVKLFTLDCGTIEMFDISSFSSEGHFADQSATLSVPCYLIRHPKGDLLWDTGHNQSIADLPEGLKASWGISTTNIKLTDQLTALGMTPADIDYLSLSHWHPDHSGNAGLFASATWVVHTAEREFMFSDAMKDARSDYAALENAKTIQFTESYDLFSDGSVVIVPTPGHTAGHTVLQLTLANAGTLLFSGDLYTHAEARKVGAVPVFNVDKEETIRSMALFEKLVKQHKARVVVEHEKTHFDALPKFPSFLD